MSAGQPQVVDVRFEHHHDGFGIGSGTPRISWSFSNEATSVRDWYQTHYQIEITRPKADGSAQAQVETVQTSASILVPWPSTPLQSREEAQVRVRVRGEARSPNSGTACTTSVEDQGQRGHMDWSEWSPWASVEASLLSRDDWTASLIHPSLNFPRLADDGSLRPVMFRSPALNIHPARVKSATLYATAHGVYHVRLSGKPVGDHCMAPGWTSYKHRLQYQTYRVTDLVRESAEVRVEIEVAAGWFASALGWAGGRRCRFGDKLAALAQLHVKLESEDDDNVPQELILSTDASWECAPSATIHSEIYNGETWDARLAGSSVTNHQKWEPAQLGTFPEAKLVSPDAPPVRVTGMIQPVAVLKSPSGKTILDFGQNIVGKLQINLLGKEAGHTVRFWHAEVLEHGELGRRPLRFADSCCTVVSGGEIIRDWSPRFTFHGFQYVQVDGWSAEDAHGPLRRLPSQPWLCIPTCGARDGSIVLIHW